MECWIDWFDWKIFHWVCLSINRSINTSARGSIKIITSELVWIINDRSPLNSPIVNADDFFLLHSIFFYRAKEWVFIPFIETFSTVSCFVQSPNVSLRSPNGHLLLQDRTSSPTWRNSSLSRELPAIPDSLDGDGLREEDASNLYACLDDVRVVNELHQQQHPPFPRGHLGPSVWNLFLFSTFTLVEQTD